MRSRHRARTSLSPWPPPSAAPLRYPPRLSRPSTSAPSSTSSPEATPPRPLPCLCFFRIREEDAPTSARSVRPRVDRVVACVARQVPRFAPALNLPLQVSLRLQLFLFLQNQASRTRPLTTPVPASIQWDRQGRSIQRREWGGLPAPEAQMRALPAYPSSSNGPKPMVCRY
ncbi:uncharacterized protein LOC125512204 [Triticum urartu]|uniref:uncharacterized protein LOC125512204 n=1 Tax=Triticum urartu TaxID=4572 RepID=UPI0020438871|nr:uncharacterized protein LOC125512204 [Triticum urartu]